MAEEVETPWDIGRFFKYPYTLIMLLTILAAALFVLFGLKRFWPEKEPREEPSYGKERLIANSARLLTRAGFDREVFLRRLNLCLHSMGRMLHAPPRAFSSETDLLNWLGSRGGTFGGTFKKPISALYMEAVAAAKSGAPWPRLLFYAQLFHKRKKEIKNWTWNS
jgi:hypothetical protein